MSANELSGHGGSYRIDADGALVRVEAPTEDHPQGNRARDAHGRPLDETPASPAPPHIDTTAPTPAVPAPGESPPRPVRRAMTAVPTVSTEPTKE